MKFYYKKNQVFYGLIVFLFLSFFDSYAQTNPPAQAIPYSQDFGLTYFSTLPVNTVPVGFAVWNANCPSCGSVGAAAGSAGLSDQTVDTAQVPKVTADAYGYSGFSGGVPNDDGQFYIQTSTGGQGTCQLILAVNTTGYSGITVGYDVEMISAQTRTVGVVFQYRIGSGGAWTTIDNSYVHSIADRAQNTVDNFFFTVPAAPSADNQPVVQFRWATMRAGAAGAYSGIAIDNILVNGNLGAFVPQYFRSIATGTWKTPAVWEASPDSIGWAPAIRYPTNADHSIHLRGTNNISTSGLTFLVMDEVTIDAGATLWNASTTKLSITDGPYAVDLQVDGTFEDSSATSVVWAGTDPRWCFGANGTYVKANHSGSRIWQLKYYNPLSLSVLPMPSTANWIVRKPVGLAIEPALPTTNGGPPNPQSTYPNLYIENYTASWNAYNNCRWRGSNAFPVVKGNLYVGGNGTGNVTLINDDVFPTPMLVVGNVVVKAGSSMLNEGTGIEIQGDVINNGIINYMPSILSKILFTGGNSQTISGTGSFSTYTLEINKTANNVTVNQPMLVDGNLSLTNGKFFTAVASPIIVNDNATVTGVSNTSFVSGPVTKLGDDAFTFPVGKNADYQSIGISAAVTKLAFWTELFNNGCASNCPATGFSGVNGAWTQTLTGVNGTSANSWYVSGSECGNASGACQSSGCPADASLHIGSVLTAPPDLNGATYEFGGAVLPQTQVQTDKRIESPVINCTGRYGIILDFNYVEGGSATADNAVLWYFNGVSWSVLADLYKTVIGGACGVKSTWTKFRVNLPASSNNNPSVKLGFQWINDINGVGNNPSFAVDDITLTDQSDAFTAEYFHTDPHIAISSNLSVIPPLLNHISYCEYWTLTRDFGSATKNVTLAWDANSCGVTNLSELRVARYNPTAWQDEGNSSTTGSVVAGTVTSNITTGFGPFTLSSSTSNNPLPISLLFFNAKYNSKNVDLKWTTVSEQNNDYFSVQRSRDGILFEDLMNIDGAGNSTETLNYSTIDKSPYQGTSYYRLKQTDFNGLKIYSSMVAVRINEDRFDIMSVNHNSNKSEVDVTIFFPMDGMAQVSVFDLLGNIIFRKSSPVANGTNQLKIQVPGMKNGLYFMQILFNDQEMTRKFLY